MMINYWSVVVFFFFFFKQKTAYEMRISDWSSDVCSSDLLVRTKNMASVLTQILAVASLAMILWVTYGYGLAFGGDANRFVSAGKWFLGGMTAASTAATFTDGVVIPEFVDRKSTRLNSSH